MKQRTRRLAVLSDDLVGSLPAFSSALRAGMVARPLSDADLPAELYHRWVSPETGQFRIDIVPKEDLSDDENLRTFVADVRAVVPDVTDLPIIYLEAGRAVVKAFLQASVIAFAVIALLLLLVLRSVRSTLLVLFPLVLAGALTGATTVVLGIPFNFANVIVLPLIFGLGVDSGIHIVRRARAMGGHGQLLRTSTARGVVFSGLTTLASFTSLAFIPHRGIASMGQLLVIGIGFVLVAMLLILPAFHNMYAGGRESSRASQDRRPALRRAGAA